MGKMPNVQSANEGDRKREKEEDKEGKRKLNPHETGISITRTHTKEEPR
jgi:hypothetical protein